MWRRRGPPTRPGTRPPQPQRGRDKMTCRLSAFTFKHFPEIIIYVEFAAVWIERTTILISFPPTLYETIPCVSFPLFFDTSRTLTSMKIRVKNDWGNLEVMVISPRLYILPIGIQAHHTMRKHLYNRPHPSLPSSHTMSRQIWQSHPKLFRFDGSFVFIQLDTNSNDNETAGAQD